MNVFLWYVFGILGVLCCSYSYNKDNYIVPKNKFECSRTELIEHESTCVQYTIKR